MCAAGGDSARELTPSCKISCSHLPLPPSPSMSIGHSPNNSAPNFPLPILLLLPAGMFWKTSSNPPQTWRNIPCHVLERLDVETLCHVIILMFFYYHGPAVNADNAAL